MFYSHKHHLLLYTALQPFYVCPSISSKYKFLNWRSETLNSDEQWLLKITLFYAQSELLNPVISRTSIEIQAICHIWPSIGLRPSHLTWRIITLWNRLLLLNSIRWWWMCLWNLHCESESRFLNIPSQKNVLACLYFELVASFHVLFVKTKDTVLFWNQFFPFLRFTSIPVIELQVKWQLPGYLLWK